MTLPLGLESGVQTRDIGIASGHAMRHMIERVPHARIAATPHHHLTAFPALLRDGRHAALRSSHLVIALGQRLGRFGKQPGCNLPPHSR